MDKDVIVSLTSLNTTLQYLVHRPYGEVVDIINSLKETIREISNEEKEDKKEVNSV